MLSVSKWKLWSTILICALGLLFALPNMLPQNVLDKLPEFLQKKVNLGLELRGGSHLQLEVDIKSVAKERLYGLKDEIRSELRQNNIGYTSLVVSSKGETPKLSFTIADANLSEKTKKLLNKIEPDVDVNVKPLKGSKSDNVSLDASKESLRNEKGVLIEVSLPEIFLKKINKKIIEQSIEVIRRRIDESGTKEPIIQRQGEDRIIVQLPGVDDPQEVKRRLGKTAKMTFHLVDPNLPDLPPTANGKAPLSPMGSGVMYLPEGKRGIYIPVLKKVSLNGDLLVDAGVSNDPGHGGIAVSFRLNDLGARKFAEISSKNIGRRFACVLDNEVITAPVFQGVIPGGQGQITGNFTIKEANELGLLLRAGALPAPLKVIEERTVGPSLGADSVKDGKMATIVAFLFVSVFMIASYSLFGAFADIALFFNLIFLIAGLSILQATLTLPGIAGIALTIGMAVDANVLIYERIKEELRMGATPVMAIDAGYRRAMTTIIDSNLTTLLGSAVLFEFGTGPIRGFGVTLALGILISLFTALSLNRIIIIKWLRGRRLERLPI